MDNDDWLVRGYPHAIMHSFHHFPITPHLNTPIFHQN
jgi:hypothetical protein